MIYLKKALFLGMILASLPFRAEAKTLSSINEFSAVVTYGDRVSRFQLTPDKTELLLVQTGEATKKAPISAQNAAYLLSKVQNLMKMKSHDENFCPRQNIEIQITRPDKKTSRTIACLGSKTALTKSTKKFVNLLEVLF